MSAIAPAAPQLWQECDSCHASVDELARDIECPSCGGLLSVRRRLSVGGRELKNRWAERGGLKRSGVWRYRELLVPASPRMIVSYPEGNTPLVARGQTAAFAEVESLQFKHEGMNPTGSFKDRGMTVAVTQAMRVGASAIACASTGNTAASLAAYAAHAGIPGFVFVPAGAVSAGKLAQTLAYGAHVLAVRGDFDDCLRLAREASRLLDIYLVNSVNPYRLQGQKTIIFELVQQLNWRAPDWIALPAGNLGNISAFGEALREMAELGLIDRMPRLLAVQASGAAPFAASYMSGFARRYRVRPETRASAIRIGDPASYDRAVRALQYTKGIATAVSDDEIFEAKRVLDRAGVGCEPASAASLAGVRRLRAAGKIRPDDKVVCILTGHLLKDTEQLDVRPPVEVDPTIREVERVLNGAVRTSRVGCFAPRTDQPRSVLL